MQTTSNTRTTRQRGPQPASDAQVRFFNTLATERGLPVHNGQDRRTTSTLIERMKATPRTTTAPAENLPAVPDGRYAIRRTTEVNALGGNDAIVFIKVDTGAAGGRHEGRRFLDRIIGGDQSEPIKGALKAKVMAVIHGDLRYAAELYGREMKRCSFCAHELSDDDSRAMGIGPDCFKKHFGRARNAQDVAEAIARAEGRVTHRAEQPLEADPAVYWAAEDAGNRAERLLVEAEVADMRSAEGRAADAALEAASAHTLGRFIAAIPAALAAGKAPECIIAAVREDERLIPAHVAEFTAAVQGAASADQDDAVQAAISKAYAEGDSALGARLTEEAGPAYVARQRARYGW